MLPTLRTTLRTVSYRNQSLQDILKTCKLSKEVIQVLPIQTELHNTILTTRLKTGKIRTHYYNRLDLGQILQGIVIRGTSTTNVIHELNTEQHCDFTEEDVEVIGTHLVAKENSLGFVGRHALNGQAPGGGGPGPDLNKCAIASGEIRVSPDIYYGEFNEGGRVSRVDWKVEVNGQLQPDVIKAGIEDANHFEEWLQERWPRHFEGVWVSGEGSGQGYVSVKKLTPGCASFKLIPSTNPFPLMEEGLSGIFTEITGNRSWSVDDNGVIEFSLVGPGEPDENSNDLDYVAPPPPPPEGINAFPYVKPYPQTIEEFNTINDLVFAARWTVINPFTDSRVRNVGAQTGYQRWTYSNINVAEWYTHGFSIDKVWLDDILDRFPSDTLIGEFRILDYQRVTVGVMRDLLDQELLREVNGRYYEVYVSQVDNPHVRTNNVSIYTDPQTDDEMGQISQRISISFAVVVPEQGDPGYEGNIDPDDGPVQLENFDFAIIRYIWTDGGGRDLDTRTYLSQPYRKASNVGWSRSQNDGEYLRWGGDNTGSGVEAILLNMIKVAQDHPGVETLKVSMNAFWYSSRSTGNFKVQFEMYKGGTMAQNGYDWLNTGGQRTQSLTVDCNVQVTQSDDIDGVEVVTLEYNPTTMVGNLIRL